MGTFVNSNIRDIFVNLMTLDLQFQQHLFLCGWLCIDVEDCPAQDVPAMLYGTEVWAVWWPCYRSVFQIPVMMIFDNLGSLRMSIVILIREYMVILQKFLRGWPLDPEWLQCNHYSSSSHQCASNLIFEQMWMPPHHNTTTTHQAYCLILPSSSRIHSYGMATRQPDLSHKAYLGHTGQSLTLIQCQPPRKCYYWNSKSSGVKSAKSNEEAEAV